MSGLTRSPLAPDSFPALPVISGARFSAIEAGVRYQGRPDVMLAVLDAGSVVAGVFTRSATRSAPVLDCQEKVTQDSALGAAIIVNAGNANAFTGRNGMDATAAVTAAVAAATGLPQTRVFSSSTGVIGEPLAHDRITSKISELVATLDPGSLPQAAEAIRTTDTFAKGASASAIVDGQTVRIAGIAKGSGMIAPDMATMLVYIFTDAKLSRETLQHYVSSLNEITFNCITVDSDTSTSDTLLMAATGASDVDIDQASDAGKGAFAQAVHTVMQDLAHQVVRDGEGATKFVTVQVRGAVSDSDARRAARAIADSPLVKTAIAGEDPNWGRVVMAVGKSGAQADRDLLSIRFGDVLVAENGWVSPDYQEAQGAAVMKESEITIDVDLGLGTCDATLWTCDLTHGYISINADYRS